MRSQPRLPRFAPWLSLSLVVALALVAMGCDPSQDQAQNNATAQDQTLSDAHQPDAEAEAKIIEIDASGLEALVQDTAARDQVLIVDFWATWCVPCVKILPDLHQALKERGDGVRGISVSFDDAATIPAAEGFLRKHNAIHDAFIVPTGKGQVEVVNRLGDRWVDVVVPAFLVYNTKGELVAEILADDPEEQMIERILSAVDAELARGS